MNKAQYDQLAQQYTQLWSSDEFYDERHRRFKCDIAEMEDYLVAQVARTIRNDITVRETSDVLDLGCGTGRLTKALLDRLGVMSPKYTGVDCNKRILAEHVLKSRAECDLSVDLVNEDMNAYVPGRRFDIIVSLNSWYAMRCDGFETMLGFLQKNGILVILMNSRDGIFHKVKSGAGGFGMVASEDAEEIFTEMPCNLKASSLRYEFSSEKDDWSWTRYLSRGKDVDLSRLLCDTTPIEVETLFIVSPCGKGD